VEAEANLKAVNSVNKNRRNFAKLLPLVLVGGFAYPVGRFVFFSDKRETTFSLPLQNIKEGITYIQSSQLFIYKNQHSIDILDAHCTHMGCILSYDETQQQFKCPCHKSKFDSDGTRLSGPAKRNLDKIEFKIKDKTLFVG
jgi:Rieske Fe-S protein